MHCKEDCEFDEDPDGDWVRYDEVDKIVKYVDKVLNAYPRFFWPDFAAQEQLLQMAKPQACGLRQTESV
jgi:hypothetical protein